MKLFKNYLEQYRSLPKNMKSYVTYLLIGNVFSISGIFIETYGLFGIIGLFIILFAFTRFSGYHYSHLKFYRKLSKHEIWIKDYDIDGGVVDYIWKPVDKSFYIPSENCSGCYTLNPFEVFDHYIKHDKNYEYLLFSLDRSIENKLVRSYFNSEYLIEYSKRDIYIIGNRDKCIDYLLK